MSSCCDDYGKCTQGFNCPVRESFEEMPIVMLDEPIVTFDQFMRYFGAFCAGIGFVAACIAAGLYFGSVK